MDSRSESRNGQLLSSIMNPYRFGEAGMVAVEGVGLYWWTVSSVSSSKLSAGIYVNECRFREWIVLV